MADEGANILLSKTVPPWLIPRASYIIPQKSQKNTNFLWWNMVFTSMIGYSQSSPPEKSPPSHWPPSNLAETRRPPCFAPGSAWWPCPGAGGLWPTNSIGGFWGSFLKLGLGGAEHLEKRGNKTMENLSRKKRWIYARIKRVDFKMVVNQSYLSS